MRTRHPICFSFRSNVSILLAAAVLISGCPRVLYLNYQPSTSVKGSGDIQVDRFVYSGHPTGLMKKKELGSSARDPEALYLSRDIAVFFHDALEAELTYAGYDVRPASAREISGRIEEFFLDYVGEEGQRFTVQVSLQVTKKDAPVFNSSCRSDSQRSKDWMQSGSLIERGVRDCIDEFLKIAQSAGAL